MKMINKISAICYNSFMKIIKEYRKTLSLKINEKGEIEIRAPFTMKEKKILEFVNEKQKWIEKQQKKIQESNDFGNMFDFKNNVYINGRALLWKEIEILDKRQTKNSYYSKMLEQNLIPYAKNLAEILNLKADFKIVNSKGIWGSCNNQNLIKLNWKVIILPLRLQEYIIIHELCHLFYMDHSKDFWKRVEIFLPNYKNLRKELKNYAFLLRKTICI